MYEEQISQGGIAMTQSLCEPDLQSSNEQWGSYLALTSAAVHWCCITVHLYEKQISQGAIAMTQCLL